MNANGRCTRWIIVVVVLAILGRQSLAANRKSKQPANDNSPASQPSDVTTVKLPGPVDASCVGGGGRYLILHLKKLRQLAVFDVSQAKVVKYLPMPGDDVTFSAGAEKLFIGLKDLKMIQRWDLGKLERELTVNAPEGGIAEIATGANANAPVVLLADQHAKRSWLLDPRTLAAEQFPSKNWGNDGSAWGPVHVHVSFDGSTVVACGGGWAGIELTTVSAGLPGDVHAGSYVNGDTLVSGNGAMVFPDGGGILRSDLETKVTGIEGHPIPGDDPNFSLAVLKERDKQPTLTIFSNSDVRPLITLRNFPELAHDSKIPFWQRIHLIPSFKTLVTLGPGGDELWLRKFDLAEQLAASGVDYLFVESTPPAAAQRGSAYAYEMKVQSKRGQVKSELQAGPPGMTLDAGGKLKWQVPRDFADAQAGIIIQISDASGQTIFNTFTLRVEGVQVGASAPVASAQPHGTPAPPAPSSPAPAPARPRPTHRPAAVAAQPPVPPPAASGPDIGAVVALAEPFHEFHAANGGRTLVFYQQKARQLVLYDSATGKEAGTIPLGADNVRFTCGLDSIIVALPDQKILQRYSLKTRERVKSSPIPDPRPLKNIKMGNASRGAVFLYFGGELVAVDSTALQQIKYRGSLPSGNPDWWFDYRVSADGSTVICWDPYASPSVFMTARLKNGAATVVNSAEWFGMGNRKFTPTADGSLVLYESSVYDAGGHAVASDLKSQGYQNSLPTSDPRFFIALKGNKQRTAMALCTTNDRRVLAQLDDLPDLGNPDATGDCSHYGLVADGPGKGEPRLIYLPDSKKLVVVPQTNDRFGVMDFSLGAPVASTPAAGSSTGSPLAVISLPPAEVALNATYSYQIQVVPEKAAVRFKVESGPPDLTVSPTGVVTWKPSERPIGGKVNVILSISDAAGHEVPHSFDIAVTREPAAGPDGVESTGEIARADAHRIELPSGNYQYTQGLGGHGLLLAGNQLAILSADGFTIQKKQTLPRSYIAIGERRGYYVAICQDPRTVDVIDKATLKVIRGRPVAFNALSDMVLHPSRPISYVSYVQPGEIPHHHFLIFDELTGDAHTDDNWIGQWLCISPDGNFLMAGLQETYENGHDIIDNPDRIWIVPTYGSFDSMCRYDLDDRSGIPERVAHRENVGGNGSGLRLSPDGKRATYLSFTGYPPGSRNLGGWDALDLGKLPVSYPTKDVASTKDIAYHPILPLVACFGKGSIAFFNRETGEKESARINDDEIAGEEPQRIYFSPDGKSILLETVVQSIHYLYHLPLKLSAEETQTVGALPRPDKPMDAAPHSPAATPHGKLPQMRAAAPDHGPGVVG